MLLCAKLAASCIYHLASTQSLAKLKRVCLSGSPYSWIAKLNKHPEKKTALEASGPLVHQTSDLEKIR